MNHEWTTSYELVIIVKLTCAGSTSVLFVRNKRRAKVTGTSSERCLLYFILFRTNKKRQQTY